MKNSTAERIMIIEDDIEFTKTARITHAARITRNMDRLDLSYPAWQLLYLGQATLGPIWPTIYSSLVQTSYPCSSHAFIIRRKTMNVAINNPTLYRPHVFEYWTTVPFWSKFSLFPIIALQNRIPKECRRLFSRVSAVKFQLFWQIYDIVIFLVSNLLFLVLLCMSCRCIRCIIIKK